jgi:hypothetical protein
VGELDGVLERLSDAGWLQIRGRVVELPESRQHATWPRLVTKRSRTVGGRDDEIRPFLLTFVEMTLRDITIEGTAAERAVSLALGILESRELDSRWGRTLLESFVRRNGENHRALSLLACLRAECGDGDGALAILRGVPNARAHQYYWEGILRVLVARCEHATTVQALAIAKQFPRIWWDAAIATTVALLDKDKPAEADGLLNDLLAAPLRREPVYHSLLSLRSDARAGDGSAAVVFRRLFNVVQSLGWDTGEDLRILDLLAAE